MLLSCGDALIDFLPVKSVDGRDAIVPVVGGSCLNIAVGMARLGAPAGFVGGISTDLFGRMIADHALASQVELRYATRSEHQTTLAFVRTVGGEPQYAFYDEATASRNWVYRRGSIPFDEIEAHPCRVDDARRRQGGSPGACHGRGCSADQPPSRSIRIAGPISSGTRPAMSIGWMRLPPPPTSCGCRMSTLNFCMAAATMREGRSHSSRRVQAWSSSRAESRELRHGIERRARLKSRRPPWMSWIPSGPATVFKPRCCSPCAPSDGSEPERWRR